MHRVSRNRQNVSQENYKIIQETTINTDVTIASIFLIPKLPAISVGISQLVNLNYNLHIIKGLKQGVFSGNIAL